MVSVNIRYARLRAEFNQVASVNMPIIGNTVLRAAQVNIAAGGNIVTGALFNSGSTDVKLNGYFPSVSIRFSRPYARYVHNGTMPHDITPKSYPRGFLHFQGSDGTPVFTKFVVHPGYVGNPFLADAKSAIL